MAPDRRRPAYRGRLSRLRQTSSALGQRRAARRGMVGDQALRLIELSGASDDERAGQATVLGQPKGAEGPGLEPRSTGLPRGGPPALTYSSVVQSAKSDQKYGTASWATSRPTMLQAAVRPYERRPSARSARPPEARRGELGHVAGGEDAPRRSSRGGRTTHATPLPESEPGRAGEHASGVTPAPNHHAFTGELAPRRRRSGSRSLAGRSLSERPGAPIPRSPPQRDRRSRHPAHR